MPLPALSTRFNTKYSSRFPLVRFANWRLLEGIAATVAGCPAGTTLDVGCGEGMVLHYLATAGHADRRPVTGVDIEGRRLLLARDLVPEARFVRGSACALPFADDSFDLVICCEVLEHLPEPDEAMQELCRVSRGTLVLSVPNHRVLCMANMLRLKYLKAFGRTPNHLQAWNRRTFRAFLASHCRVESVRSPLNMWHVATCRT